MSWPVNDKQAVKELRDTLLHNDEVEFSRGAIDYFINHCFGYLKVWRCTYPARLVFETELNAMDTNYSREIAQILNAPIFDDGASMIAVPGEITVEWAG